MSRREFIDALVSRVKARVLEGATEVQETYGLHSYIEGGFMYGSIHVDYGEDDVSNTPMTLSMGLSWVNDKGRSFYATRECSAFTSRRWTEEDYSDFEDHCVAELLGRP